MTDPAEIAEMLRQHAARARAEAYRGQPLWPNCPEYEELLAEVVKRYGGSHSVECVAWTESTIEQDCICGADDWLRRVAALEGGDDGIQG